VKKEKPFKVIPHNGKHKTETRVFARNIHESFCRQPGCRFRGKPSVQGVCHTRETFEGGTDWAYVDALIAGGDRFVTELRASMARQKLTTKQRLSTAETHLACAWSNTISTTDELVRLRREVSLLRDRLNRKNRRA
jgi:hypothetical protein